METEMGIEIENPKCCGVEMFRSYTKERTGKYPYLVYLDFVFICRRCNRELFTTVREISKGDKNG